MHGAARSLPALTSAADADSGELPHSAGLLMRPIDSFDRHCPAGLVTVGRYGCLGAITDAFTEAFRGLPGRDVLRRDVLGARRASRPLRQDF